MTTEMGMGRLQGNCGGCCGKAPTYEIRVEGGLDPSWSAWFDGMTLTRHPESGDTLLRGAVADQCALHGLLVKVRDLHLTLIWVRRVEGAEFL